MSEFNNQRRKQLLDPITGAWSERGFCELIRRTLRDVASGKAHAALCAIKISNLEDFSVGLGEEGAHELRTALIAQFIRQRIPRNAVLCCMPGGRACVMFGAHDKGLLQQQIASFLQHPGHKPIAGITFTQQLKISSAGLNLKPEHDGKDPEHILDAVMSRLTEKDNSISVLF